MQTRELSAVAVETRRVLRRLDLAVTRECAGLAGNMQRTADRVREVVRAFQLEDRELRHTFYGRIVPAQFGRSIRAAEHPRLLVVTGQPASGKSTAIRELAETFPDEEGVAVLIADDYMRYHPRYAELRARNDFTAGDHVYPTAESWLDLSIAHAIINRHNVILEEGVGNLQRALDIVEWFDLHGYRSGVEAMAVRRSESRLSNLVRFLEERIRSGTGRYVPISAQDVCFTGSSDLVRVLESGRFRVSIDNLRIRSRSGVFFENHRMPDGIWADTPAGWDSMDRERRRMPTLDERAAHTDLIKRVRAEIERGRQLRPDDAHVWDRLADELDDIAAESATPPSG